MQGLAVFRSGDTGLSTANMTLSVKVFATGVAVATTGWAVAERFPGVYLISVPLATEISLFDLSLNGTSPLRSVMGWLDDSTASLAVDLIIEGVADEIDERHGKAPYTK